MDPVAPPNADIDIVESGGPDGFGRSGRVVRALALAVVAGLAIRGLMSVTDAKPHRASPAAASTFSAAPSPSEPATVFIPEGLVDSWAPAPSRSLVVFAVPLISTLRTDVTITAAVLVGSNLPSQSGNVTLAVVKRLPAAADVLTDELPSIGDAGVSTPARSDIAYLVFRVAPECDKGFAVGDPRVYLSFDVGSVPSFQVMTELPNAPGFSGENWLTTWVRYACQHK